MDPTNKDKVAKRNEFIKVENRIRALTTILKNLNHHITPSSDPKDVPAFLRHFVNLLTTGDKTVPDAKKVVAMTASILPNGTIKTLVVTQNPFSKSGVKNLCIEDVSKSKKSFDEIVDLEKRDDNVDLKEYISDLWAALTQFQSVPKRYVDLHTFVVYRSYRKLFKRVIQDTKTWKVHVAEKILAWTPTSNELRKGPRWFEFPKWLHMIPPEQLQMVKTRKRGAPGKEVIEVEFSNATVNFWALLLGKSLLKLELIVDTADKKRKDDDVEGFKKDLAMIANWCNFLHLYVNWSARIVETLLTETTLSHVFNLPQGSNALDDDDDNSAGHNNDTDDDSADMSRETSESDGHLVLRHLRAMLSWSAALESLTSRKHLHIINGELEIGLVQVPYAGCDIARIEDITKEFFERFPLRSVNESGRTQDTDNLKRDWKSKFTGTTHAEASLMGLLTYYSEPASSRADYWDALADPKMAQRMEVLIGPTEVTNKVIGVGKKCCWCCSALGSILSEDKNISIKLPGSHGIIYPWSPPRVGLDLSVLRRLEEQLWEALYTAIDKAEFGVPLSRQTSGSSSVDEDSPREYFSVEQLDVDLHDRGVALYDRSY